MRSSFLMTIFHISISSRGGTNIVAELRIPFAFDVMIVVNLKFPVWSRHLCEFLLHQERFLPHYHRRSNVETVFAMIKAKFGGSVLSRNPVAQINEVLAKCVSHNLCCVVKAIFTAGLAPRFWSDAPLTLVQP